MMHLKAFWSEMQIDSLKIFSKIFGNENAAVSRVDKHVVRVQNGRYVECTDCCLLRVFQFKNRYLLESLAIIVGDVNGR